MPRKTSTVENRRAGANRGFGPSLFFEFPRMLFRETVWKVSADPKPKPLEISKRDEKALFQCRC